MKAKIIQFLVVLIWINFLLVGCGGNSATPSIPLATTCANLNGTSIDDVTITSTKWYEASGDHPAFCQNERDVVDLLS